MKKILYSLIILASVAFVISCADESLDPLPTNTVIKGTMLALRGDQLNKIYFDGELYGASFFGNYVTGEETFDFDTEFLSSDPTSLASFDVYVVKLTWNGKGYTSERVLLTNIPASQFKKTDDYANPWTSVSIKLTDILTKIELDPINKPADQDTLLLRYQFGIGIQSDINLTDGTKVLSSQIQAAGLFQSDQFYPASILSYGVTDVNDSRPVPTISQRGIIGPVVAGKITRPVIPLKEGAMDTINISFNQAIDTPPTLTVSPDPTGAVAGELVGELTRNVVKGKESDSDFYILFKAVGNTYTGNVKLTLTDATSGEGGAQAGLEMEPKSYGVAVDNLAPVSTSFSTADRVGLAGSVTFTVKFNEKMGKAPKVTIDVTNTNVDPVTEKPMTLSADGLSATYNYDYKDTDKNATHGTMSVKVEGGTDVAGNEFGTVVGSLTIDIGVPPPPAIALDGTQYDWGTQIKWTIIESNGLANANGAKTGTVYYVAVAAGSEAPTAFVAGDAPAFTIKGKSVKPDGSATISSQTSGSTGSIFSPLTANGDLDVYAVFVGTTGNMSPIGAPVSITMN